MTTLRTKFNRWLTIAGVVSLAWTATGCSAEGPLYVDSHFSQAECLEIEAAAQSWRDAGATIDLVYGVHVNGLDSGRRELVRTTRRGAAGISESFRTADGRHIDREVVAVAASLQDIIVAMDAVADGGNSLQTVVAHEMGHLLGLDHFGAKGETLMSEYGGPESPLGPTAVDVEECRRIGACTAHSPASPESQLSSK